MKTVRCYILRLYGSESKFEDLKWSAYQYTKITNSFISHFYFNENISFYSTKGLGLLGNQAQRKAKGIVSSKKTNEQQNGHKKSCPLLSVQQCFANIEKLSNHHFNYKINFSLGFDVKSKSRYLFAKGIKPLKTALKQYWELSDQCEIFFNPKDNHWYVRVFVSKEIQKAQAQTSSIGIDVGISHIISTSEGFLGNSLSKRLKKLNQSKKEKQRQFALAKNRNQKELVEKLKQNLTKNKSINKTVIKQLLDKEAKRLIACGLATSSNLVVEDPKVLANLRGNKSFVRWAKTYLAYRLQVLGREKGVFVVFTNPAYTSQTCYKCGEQDKMSRQGLKFHCQKCGHIDHADLNAAKNLSVKGQNFVDLKILKIIKATVRAPLGSI